MARAIWKGHVSFGLVNIPVSLFSGEKRADLQFRLLDSRDKARVRYERVNEATGEEVPWSEVVRAFEYDDGNYIVLDEEDFKRAAVEATQTVEIEDFVDEAEISAVYFDKPYYLVPGKKGEKGYVLLREALRKSGMAGIAKVVIRTRQYLAALLVQDDALLLNLLRFRQELRLPDEFDLPSGKLGDYKISTKEMNMAEKLVESMSGKWKPEQYHDEYRNALMKWIEQKAEKGEQARPPAAEEDEGEEPGIINIMDLLKQSVEESSGGRSRKPKSAKSTSKGKSGKKKSGGAGKKQGGKKRKKAS